MAVLVDHVDGWCRTYGAGRHPWSSNWEHFFPKKQRVRATRDVGMNHERRVIQAVYQGYHRRNEEIILDSLLQNYHQTPKMMRFIVLEQ